MDNAQLSRDELQRQLASLERSLADLSAAGVDETMLAPLRLQAANISRHIATRGGAVVAGDVDTGGGPFVGRDLIIGAESPPEDLLRAYFRAVAADCKRLPLGVIDTEYVRTSGEQPIPLPDIYVDLDVVAPAQERDESERSWALRLSRGEGDSRTPLLQALLEPVAAKAVLLGSAGSGKTTFVNYLTYLLSTGDPAVPGEWRTLLPIRLLLRDVAARCIPAEADKGTADMLWEALKCDVTAQLGAVAAERVLPYLQKRVLAEGCFVLLDGLDEVPEACRRRAVLLQAIRTFTDLLEATPSRVLVTARPYAYADKKWQVAGFATLALAPFDEAQIERFTTRWYAAARPFMGWSEETARDKGSRLHAAILERSYLGDLASRPLLLTLMATLHSSWGQLPEDRAGLYEETVRLLLGRWQRAREIRSADGELVIEPGIAQALDAGEDRIRAALEALAYKAHASQRSQDPDEGPANIGEGEILTAFKPLLGTLDPDTLLAYLNDRAGLLVASREGAYAFPHRSFQEYLAACHLAYTESEFAARLRELIWEDPAWWREVFLLGVGKKRQGGLDDAVNVINTLVPQDPQQVPAITDAHWRAAALAGQAVLELRLAAEACSQPHCQAVVQRVRGWLAKLVVGGHLPPRERLQAGDVLARLGDPRPGVGVISSLAGPQPDILWIEIPGGPFMMGSPQGDDQAYADEEPVHQLSLPAYYISRYPITNAQYGVFVTGGGYENRDLWTSEGWAWRQGAEADLSGIDDADLRQQYAEWLAGRPVDRRDRPFWWGNSRVGAPTRPVIGICWFEALAYCRWLQDRLWQAGSVFRIWRRGRVMERSLAPGAFCIQLPSEAEWEKAARGRKGLRWPWGNKWQDGAANTEEAHVNETSPVGMFLGGASPYEVADMAGNVWEWTRSKWGKKIDAPDYGYPYDPGEGREDLSGMDFRVVRGGSWNGNQRCARCACRYWDGPVIFDYGFGFRVVASLSDSGFEFLDSGGPSQPAPPGRYGGENHA